MVSAVLCFIEKLFDPYKLGEAALKGGGEGFDVLFFVITAKADAQGAICGLEIKAEGKQGRARLLRM